MHPATIHCVFIMGVGVVGVVDIQDIHFSYPSRPSVEILKGISFTIEPGQKIAIVGTSGTGKSTLAQLMMRFYEPSQGKIMMGEYAIQDMPVGDWRKMVALVPQEVLLFGGSIRENIAYGKPGASEQEIQQAAEQAYANNLDEAERLLAHKLESTDEFKTGEVYLVGGGPGDPDLLTFKALRLMQQADIVLYDRLVSPEVLNLVRRDATRIYVGKTAGDHPVTQDNINQKLVDYALEGNRVVRLKGGDPFIFGRGGEEIETLAEHGIPFQVVPGITAASGCASYAGIPLTHRDHAQSVRFIAGHLRSGKMDLNWPELVQPNQTLVFYMGLNGMETICEQLKQHGLDAQTPAALIEKGTTDRQQVFIGDLDNLPEIVRKAGAKAPTLIIVGHVVSLHDKLAWFNVTEKTQ